MPYFELTVAFDRDELDIAPDEEKVYEQLSDGAFQDWLRDGNADAGFERILDVEDIDATYGTAKVTATFDVDIEQVLESLAPTDDQLVEAVKTALYKRYVSEGSTSLAAAVRLLLLEGMKSDWDIEEDSYLRLTASRSF